MFHVKHCAAPEMCAPRPRRARSVNAHSHRAGIARAGNSPTRAQSVNARRTAKPPHVVAQRFAAAKSGNVSISRSPAHAVTPRPQRLPRVKTSLPCTALSQSLHACSGNQRRKRVHLVPAPHAVVPRPQRQPSPETSPSHACAALGRSSAFPLRQPRWRGSGCFT